MMKIISFWGVISRRPCRLIETFSFSFLGIGGWDTDLDYCDIECFALERNRYHSVILRLHSSTAFRTLVDYDSYSISSKGFLPTVADIMVI